jgi:hypothetical protein
MYQHVHGAVVPELILYYYGIHVINFTNFAKEAKHTARISMSPEYSETT